MKYEIDEFRIRSAVDKFQDKTPETVKSFIEALNEGEVFRENGLQPFYVFDNEDYTFVVTSLEHMENKLN